MFEEVGQNLCYALLLRPLAVGFSRMLAVWLQIGGARLDERVSAIGSLIRTEMQP